MGNKYLIREYPLFSIYHDKDDIKAVLKVITRGSYWAEGKEIKKFEKKLSSYLGSKYCVVFNSGTSALYSVLLAYGITSGEVIVPSFSFIATANCVVLAGAVPIFTDIEKQTLGLDPNDIEKKITNKTKAIIPMHYGGRVCRNIKKIREIADQHGIILIEDNAESLGAKIDDKFSGTFGHAGVQSFCQNKVITTGEGGAVNTNDSEIYDNLKLIRSHGRTSSNYFSDINESDYIQAGFNFRMSSICASLGISQLNKIEKIIEERRKVGKIYSEHLKEISQVQIIPELYNQRNVYQLYSIYVDRRTELQKYLLEKGIFSKVYFHPIHLKSFYRQKYGCQKGFLPVTEDISKKILSLPISAKLPKKDQMYIIKKIKEFYKEKK